MRSVARLKLTDIRLMVQFGNSITTSSIFQVQYIKKATSYIAQTFLKPTIPFIRVYHHSQFRALSCWDGID